MPCELYGHHDWPDMPKSTLAQLNVVNLQDGRPGMHLARGQRVLEVLFGELEVPCCDDCH